MNHKLIFTLVIVALCGNAFGQTLKYRVGLNYGKFNKEVGHEEVEHPLIEGLSNPNATDFTNSSNLGFEAEIMQLWSPKFETGIELDFSKFSGNNKVSPYYNYYLTPYMPPKADASASKIYESSALNVMLNLRYYLVPEGSVNPFIKVYGGLSFVAAEFNYEDQSVWLEGEAGILYAIGTENSDDPREAALCYGGGLGFDIPINERLSLYFDGTAGVIGSDKVDGIPNFDYVLDGESGLARLEPASGKAFITQFSVGIVFTSGKNLGLSKGGGGKKSGVKRTGRTTSKRPFYRQNNR